ncbi:MAG: FG-GAP-like repeat-containing protein [Pseudomonas marincola]|uniref:FG-GAP-like repeat-containing protein n=1 Tax=Pseudomonas marincola TaxID=437900 RepID=UPI003001E354
MKKKIGIPLVVVAAAGLGAYYWFYQQSEETIKSSPVELTGPAFKPVDVGFTPHWDNETSQFFSGAAVIDIDGDGKSELFISSGKGHQDGLLRYVDGRLVDVAAEAGLTGDLAGKQASYGALSFDLDNDADTDLLVTRQDGLYALINTDGKFVTRKLDITLPADSIPLSTTIADIDKDGQFDLYVSLFVAPDKFSSSVFNDPEHAKHNLMLHNVGNMAFEDVTEKTATQGTQNTFHSSFVDLNNDGLQDLVLANNTGRVEIFKNNGDLTFESIAIDSGLGYWMGIGIGDIDADGDQDLFLSNIGTSISNKLARGDLRDDQELNLDWLLLENEGDFKFHDVLKDKALDGYGFSWGGVFGDLDLDGKLDLMVAQSYIKWPPHQLNKLPGKAFVQVGEGNTAGFYQNDELEVGDPYYGQSPVIYDIDSDGRPDLFWLNMGQKPKAYLNTGKASYIKLTFADNLALAGANVTVISKAGRSYTQQLNTQAGLLTDQSNSLFFGLGDDKSPVSVEVVLANGERRTVENIAADSTTIIR